jgi:hypothetical protein
MEITVRNKVPAKILSLGTSLLTVIFMRSSENLFYCTYSYRKRFFLATNSQKIWYPSVPLEITVRNRAPAIIFFIVKLIFNRLPRRT